jgi:hypothetical protein
MFKFMINFCSALQWITPMGGGGTFPKCGARLDYRLIIGPLFENALTMGLLPLGSNLHYHVL